MSDSDDAVTSAETRLQQITSVIDTGLTSLGFADLSHELLRRVQTILDVDTVTVLLQDDRARHLVATEAVGISEDVRKDIRVPIGTGLAGGVAAQREPQALEHVVNGSTFNTMPWENGFGSLLAVPMVAGGQLVGALHVGVFAPRSFSDHERYLLQLAADRIAMNEQSDISHTERTAAVSLTRSLQPPRLPAPTGLTFAARYAPGHGNVGGDWYDVFTLPTGRIGIAIGDVAGSGFSAAAVMGRLRSALRAYALETEDPGRVLDKLDHKATYFETHTMTTVAYGIFDPATNQMHLSLAGHLAPVRALPSEPAALAGIAVDPPLGFGLTRHPRR